MPELAARVAILGCLRLVDRSTAVRAVSRRNPGRIDPGARASRRLPLRLLLALDVIVQRALLHSGHVNDDLAPVRGIAIISAQPARPASCIVCRWAIGGSSSLVQDRPGWCLVG
jgi:hypothetical protein